MRMRILGLDLRAFGPFTNEHLDLSNGESDFHLIYGPNEAGKSSALRALKQLLYGIPHQSNEDFVHESKDLFLGASLQDSNERILSFFRRKSRSKSLLAEDGKTPLDDTALASYLGGVSERDFKRLFGLDHDRLVRGGRALVEGGGDLGESLFAAGAGIADLGKVRKGLEEEARKLFVARGELPAINKTLSDLKKAREAKRAVSLRSEEWEVHHRELSAAREKSDGLDRRLDDVRCRLHRLTRIHDALPSIGRRKGLLAELSALADSAILAEDFGERLRLAQEELRLANDRERRSIEELTELDKGLATLDVPERILAKSKEIEALHLESATQGKAEREREGLRLEREQCLADAEAVLRDLHPGWGLADADKLRIPMSDRVRIQDLGNGRQVMEKASTDAQRQVEKLSLKITEVSAALEGLETPRDAGPLKRTVGLARKKGMLDELLDDARKDYQAVERQASIDLAKLGLWEGPLHQFERLAVPSVESIERYRDLLDDSDRERKELRVAIESEEARARELRLEIERLRQEGEVPTEVDLRQARGRREAGWNLVAAAWKEGRDRGVDFDAFLDAFPSAHDLRTAYERSVADADQVADRLRHEARRVETKVRAVTDLSASEDMLVHLDRKREEVDSRRASRQDQWEFVWRAVDIVPLSPKEMLTWIRKHAKLTEQSAELRRHQSHIEDLTRRIDSHRQELDTCLVVLGEARPAANESLSGLLVRAEDVIERIQQSADDRKRWQDHLTQHQAELPAAREKKSQADDELSAWVGQWAIAMRKLGLEETASPAEANAVLGRISTLFEKLDRAEEHRRDIESGERDRQQFESNVRTLTQSVGPELRAVPVPQAVETLYDQLSVARRILQEREGMLSRRSKLENDLCAARGLISEYQSRLDLLRQEAGSEEFDDLADRVRRSDQRRALADRLRAEEAQLNQFAGKTHLADFVSEAEAEDPDALAAAIERGNEQIAELDAEKSTCNQVIGRESHWLSTYVGGSSAAEKDEDVEDLRAKIEDSVAQYAPLRLAISVLDTVIERYRQKNQDPVLKRAGAIFSRLTCGSFAGLDSDLDEKNRFILRGIRSADRREIAVSGMSEGTADQLYLALRLAVLETYLETHLHARLPLILDDILINFDNARAVAALGVLLYLSRKTQVLFFTHHEHLLELAVAEFGEAVCTHRIGFAKAVIAGG
jgi:uncharacterized protein YhaN